MGEGEREDIPAAAAATAATTRRICFVTPPSPFLLDERVFVSLGILKVAAVCEHAGLPIEMLDLSGTSDCEAIVEAHLTTSTATCFALTATTPQLPSAIRIIRCIRRRRPDSRIILGGPHVTLSHAARRLELARGAKRRASADLAAIQELVDVIVAGDGEKAILQAVSNHPPPPPLIDADQVQSDLFLTDADLDAAPMPARHLVDMASYHYAIDGANATSLIAQLGCPFGCGFCGGRASPMLRRIRMRSNDSIIDELRHLHEEYGYTGFMFYDDELNVNRGLVELMHRISRLQQELGVPFHLRGFIKSELFDAAQAEAMYRAGFRWILVGFESGSPRILANIQKHATKADNSRCIAIAHSHGLKVKALMSLGHPGETAATITETRDWLRTARPDDFDVTIITPYPGSPYFDDAVPADCRPGVWVYTAKKTGDRLYAHEIDYAQTADYFKGDPNGGYRSFVYTDELSAQRLVELRDQVEHDVRTHLDIPFNPAAAKIDFEHSMGQSPNLPPTILRATEQTVLLPRPATTSPDLNSDLELEPTRRRGPGPL